MRFFQRAALLNWLLFAIATPVSAMPMTVVTPEDCAEYELDWSSHASVLASQTEQATSINRDSDTAKSADPAVGQVPGAPDTKLSSMSVTFLSIPPVISACPLELRPAMPSKAIDFSISLFIQARVLDGIYRPPEDADAL